MDSPEMNFARVCKMLFYCRNILWVIAMNSIQTDQLRYTVVSIIKSRSNILPNSVRKSLLRVSELHRMPRVKDFDIPMLQAVLRYGTLKVPAPTKGWFELQYPQPHDVTVGDDIKRIYLLHNMILCQYTKKQEVPKEQYTNIYNESRQFFKRLDESQRTTFSEKLKKVKSMVYEELTLEKEEMCQQAGTYLDKKEEEIESTEGEQRMNLLSKTGAVFNLGGANSLNAFPGASIQGPIYTEHVHIHPKVETDFVLKGINEHSKYTMKIFSGMPFVETNQYRNCVDILEKTNMVMIVGIQGEGKTATAVNICKGLQRSHEIFFLREPLDWYHILQASNAVIFIDNIFGKHNFDESRWRQWESILPNIIDKIKYGAGKLKLIITTRQHVLQCKAYNLKRSEITKVKVELGSARLSVHEKRKILDEFLHLKNRNVAKEILNSCVDAFETDKGFPYVCFLFATIDELFQQQDTFFGNPFMYFEELFNELLVKDSYKLALFLVFSSNEGFLEVDLKSEGKAVETKSKIKDSASKLGLSEQIAYPDIIKTSLDELVGSLLLEEGDKYKFSHTTVYEMYGKFMVNQYPHLIFKVCSLQFLSQCVRVSPSETEGFSFVLKTQNFKHFAERIIEEVISNKHVGVFGVHSALLSDDFVHVLWSTLDSNRCLQEFLTVTTQAEFEVERHSCNEMTFSGRHVRQSTISFAFLSRALDSANCKRLCRLSDNAETWCGMCKLVQEVLIGACQHGHLNVYVKCLEMGGVVREFSVFGAVDCSCASIVVNALSVLKDRGALRKSFLSKILLVACKRGNLETFEAIKMHGPQITSKHLVYSIHGGCNTIIEKVASELIYTEPDDRMDEAVDLTCAQGNYISYCTVRKTGVLVKTHHLYSAVKGSHNDIIKGIVTELEETKCLGDTKDMWLKKSLCLACRKGDRNTYELLCNAGIVPTSFQLCDAVRGECKEILHHIIGKLGSCNDPLVADAMVETCLRGNFELLQVICNTGMKPNTDCLYNTVLNMKHKKLGRRKLQEMVQCITSKWTQADFKEFLLMDKAGELLPYIVTTGCVDLVESMVKATDDWSTLFNSRRSSLEKSMDEACLMGNYRIFTALHQTGVSVSSESLRLATKSGKSISLVKEILNELEETKPTALLDDTSKQAFFMSGPDGVFAHTAIHNLIEGAISRVKTTSVESRN